MHMLTKEEEQEINRKATNISAIITFVAGILICLFLL